MIYRCYHGDGSDAELDELVKQRHMTVNDADAIREFREFLRLKAIEEKDGARPKTDTVRELSSMELTDSPGSATEEQQHP